MTSERRAASELQSRLRGGEFVVTAEITPPVSTDPAEFLRRALPLKGLAAAVNVTDGAGAKVHLSSLAAAHFLVQSGIEPIFQMTCRDRNRLALQADLLGAAALGIHNILVLHGDDPKVGDQPDAKPVFDVDSRGLLAMVNAMRGQGKLPSGTEIQGRFNLVIGAADMPVDPAPGWEPNGLAAKVAAGADFVQTQFCMDLGVVRRYAARVSECGVRVPILIGVAPIPSSRSARWMKEKLFGTRIADEYLRRLETATDPKREGRRICAEMLQGLADIPGIAGAHVMAPMNFGEIPAAIEEAGVLGRKRAAA
ncbi:MAG TPA: methylenetetrahydrofolate reductase [Burkholderiales bacterium]|nr:methylenetetrahydrofolate reductase [Burkholderiales bacterium]